MEQVIRFCTAADGVRVAWASLGHGSPLVKTANWLTHLEHDLHSPVWEPWLRTLTRRHRLLRYDQRGCGLSDRSTTRFDLDALVGDLEAVVDAARPDRFALLGLSQGASIAIRYAARHPDRVSHLITCGGYARGRRDVLCPYEEGRLIATAIPGAHFLPMDTANHVVLEGEPAFDTFFRAVAAALDDPGPAPAAPVGTLTGREREVLLLVARGLGNDQIGAMLHLSPRTVERHLANAYTRLGLSGRSARAAAAALVAHDG